MDTLDSQPDNIADALRRCAVASGTSPAIVGSKGEVLSYQTLLHQVERIGAVLERADLTNQDCVALVAANSADMVVAFLGIAAVAVCAPLNPSYTAAEFAFFLDDLRPRLLIVENGIALPVYDLARRRGITIWEYTGGSVFSGSFDFYGNNPGNSASRPEPEAGDRPALILHTSGTTSRQKMVPLTQRNLCFSASNIARSLGLSSSDCCLNIMPLFHIHGLVGTVLSTLISGGSVKCAGTFTPAALLGGLTDFPPSWFSAVPAMHEAVLASVEHGWQPLPRHRLRLIRSCSAPLSPRTLIRLEACFGVPVVEAYGMTEAAHQIASNPLPPEKRKPGSVGVATGTEIAFVDADGAFLKSGNTGEIVIRGCSVTSGYLGDPTASRGSFLGGWLRTGDLGRIDEDGYLFISGRIKEIINRGGEKILPREIEEVLLSYPGIAEAVAFAIPDTRLGEVVGAAIVMCSGVAAPNARSVREFAATRLAAFKLPRHIAFVDEIPLGSTGKPQRIGLAAQLLTAGWDLLPEEPEAMGAPETELERKLVGIWSKALPWRVIGVHDDFFSLGGDSLSALAMLREVEIQQGVTITIANLLNAPTISLLADLIARARSLEKQSRTAVIQPGKSWPPFWGIGAGPRFRELARSLGQDQPFVASAYPAPAELPSPCRIEDIARYHVGNIRNIQPAGPYYLSGWCIDGLVAYEVAQQLKAAGDLVALLVLFDTSFNPNFEDMSWPAVAGRWLYAVLFSLSFHVRAAVTQPSLTAFLHYVTRHFNRLGERICHQYLYLSFRFRRRRSRDENWREVAAVQHRVATKYKPQPYDGDVLLLHRSVRHWFGARLQQLWGNVFLGTLEIHEIPGDHGDMFDYPQVVVTAEKLRVKLGFKPVE